MFPTGKLRLALVSIFTLTVFCLHIRAGAESADGGGGGFHLLGSLHPTQQADEIEVTQVIYYISDYELNQDKALLECRSEFLGRLLTILTLEQDDYIRLRLQILGYGQDHIHTAGRFNGDNLVWEWATTTKEFVYKNWHGAPNNTAGLCTNLLGESSSYGWVSRPCLNAQYFVCEIAV